MGKENATADGPGRGWWSETVARTGRCPLISLDSCVAANQASHRIRAVPQCIGSQNETKSGISDDFGLQLVEVIRLQNFFGDASAYRKIGPRLLQRFRIGRARVVGDAFQRFQFLRLNRLRDQFADQLSMSSVMTFSSLHVGARMWIRLLSDHAEQLQKTAADASWQSRRAKGRRRAQTALKGRYSVSRCPGCRSTISDISIRFEPRKVAGLAGCPPETRRRDFGYGELSGSHPHSMEVGTK